MSNDQKRTPTDWERVEADYRAGQLSVREIARQHGLTEGAVRKRAKANTWARDLTGAVRKAVAAKLVKVDGTQGTQDGTHPQQRVRTDAEIVDQASDRGVAVIELHRADIAQLGEAKRIMMGRLLAHLRGEDVEGPFIGEKESPADLLEKLSRVEQRFITLGRQAFNLDEVKTGGETLAELIAESFTHEERARDAGRTSQRQDGE